jgi:hypothetical protein
MFVCSSVQFCLTFAGLKRLTAIFFILIFAASSNCYWVLNHINYLQMKARVATIIHSEAYEPDLKMLVFTNQEFSKLIFEDNGHELELNGIMYDIVKVKSLVGKKIVYCINDKKETNLKDWARKNDPQKNTSIKNILSKVYTPSRIMMPVIASINYPGHYQYPLNSENIFSISYEVIKPPPKLG